jgi:hypothetical protein
MMNDGNRRLDGRLQHVREIGNEGILSADLIYDLSAMADLGSEQRQLRSLLTADEN